MKIKKSLVAISLIVTSLASFAGPDSGPYIGVAMTQARHNYNNSFIQAIGYTSYTSDRVSTNGKIYGGYRFNRFVAAEGFYNNLGRSTFSGPIGARNSKDEFKSDGFGAAAVGRLPVGGTDLAFIGKLGLMSVQTKYACVELCNNASSTSTRAVASVIGVGVEYDFTKNLGVRVDYERISGAKASYTINNVTNTTNPTFDVFSLGLNVKF